jgi:inosine-uridine nucleoside N-ribohydrolase
MCDAYAALCFLEPSAILEYKDWEVCIELSGIHSRGLTSFDWFYSAGSKSASNARVVLKLNVDLFKEMLKDTFK